ncbi:Multicopper oxidase/laccase [Mycena venus]|uniref:Multicopper oxidase/laccase n=1 Tax=Mycena venus TaxID=2733690 RepID=A0A8H6Y5Z5_9AGAR|nr:Multicopper oxidase/laccase [Mycena venus]
MTFPALFAFALLSSAYAFGPANVRVLEIVNKNLNLDGFSRSTVVAGGTFPGTPITANKGERILVNVEDKLTDNTMLRSTSIHWHGIFQDGTSWADGPAFVTQCPIAANNSFLYDFTPSGQTLAYISGFAQAGTYWYHSHLSTQYIDGLRGPLIIYDPEDPHKLLYDVDNTDTIITLADWFHTPALNAPFPLFFTTNLINGKGRFTGGPASPLAVVTVTHGLRYRFRLISMSAEPNFIFSIDGHSMTVIEADGVSTQPVVVDSIQIFAGQRYSFVLKATQKISNYWIRSLPNFGNTSFTGGVNSAILRYLHAPICDPETNATASTKPLLETNLHPLVPVPVPGLPHAGGADVLINLNISLDLSAPRYFLTGASFTPPTSPALLQILSGAQLAQDLLPTGSYYALPPNKVIEVSIPGSADVAAPHPFHLHGHNFHVIRSAGSSTYNYVNPVIRDVVNTGTASANDNVTFRFVTDNAGPWFLHCHIDIHLDIGLAVVFAEDIPTTSKEVVPSAWKNLCPTYDALTPDQL